MNIYDFEQAIMNCWNVVDDARLLNRQILEKNNMSTDEISNFLLGLSAIYQVKFEYLFDLYEQLLRDHRVRTDEIDTNTGSWSGVQEP